MALFDEKQKKAVEKMSKKINDKSADAVEHILWNLTFKNLEYLQEKYEDVFWAKPDDLDEAIRYCTAVRNYVFNEYIIAHPTFMFGRINTDFGDDNIASCKVYSKIAEFVRDCDNAQVDRTLYLLGASNEKFFFGGIKSLGFSYKEAAYVKQHFSLATILEMIEHAIEEESKSEDKESEAVAGIMVVDKSDNKEISKEAVKQEEKNMKEVCNKKENVPESILTLLNNREFVNAIFDLDEKSRKMYNIPLSDFLDENSKILKIIKAVGEAEENAISVGLSIPDIIAKKEEIEAIYEAVERYV